MCSKLIFKRFLLKLITESTFIFGIKYYAQTDGYTMEGPLSIVLSDFYLTKLEKDAILPPRKPKFCKRFVDDIFRRRKTNAPDQFLKFLKNYHCNIKLTCETYSEKFLDNTICYNNSSFTPTVHQKVSSKRQNQVDKYIIPPNVFEVVKESALVEFSYSP